MDLDIFLLLDADLIDLQEFQMLYHHENCSDYLIDLLEFIKDKILRIDPKKRVKCNEIVKEFERLNSRCKKEENYCMKREKTPPKRTGTALSEMAAAAVLNLSDKQADLNRRGSVPILKHGGPVDNDGRVQADRKSKTQEVKFKPVLPSPMESDPLPHWSDAQTSSETQTDHHQSPKKAYFENGEQQPIASEAAEQGKVIPTTQGQPLDKPNKDEEQDEVIRGHFAQLPPHSGSPAMHSAFRDFAVDPEQSDSVAFPINSPTQYASNNITADNDGSQNWLFDSPESSSPHRVDSTEESDRTEPNDEGRAEEGSSERLNFEPQGQNIPTTEIADVPSIQPGNKIATQVTTSEPRPKPVHRFLCSLCCLVGDG